MADTKELLKRAYDPIHFIRTKDQEGRNCYFFLVCSDIKMRLLRAELSKPSVDLTRYGRVIFSAFGTTPDKDAITYLKQEYGFDATALTMQ